VTLVEGVNVIRVRAAFVGELDAAPKTVSATVDFEPAGGP
jgi:hypothetical protein